MRTPLLATTCLVALCSVASAADLPYRGPAPAPAPIMVSYAYDWTGFYAGLHAGAARTPGCTRYTAVDAYNYFNDTCRGGNESGFVGGAQIGYNFQAGSFVYGVEADISWLGDSGGSTRYSNEFYYAENGILGGNYRITGEGTPDVFGTLRARLGYAFGQWLVYATGGLAWNSGVDGARIGYWDNVVASGDPDVSWRRGGSNEFGWALGAGFEYGFRNGWTIRAEYLHLDFGDNDGSWSCTTLGAIGCGRWAGWNGRSDARVDLVRFGVNYKFGGGARAVTGPVVASY